ncbi:BppU family phage baseplate upper protein, partial [Enterococcus hirae]
MGMFKNLFVQSDRSEIELFEVKDDANLLEIKLKDTDSVPEIYYKGQRLDKIPRGLVDISYHWHTRSYDTNGQNKIHIEYYDSPNTKLMKENTPLSLAEGTTVPIRLRFKSETAEGGYGKHDYLATIEDRVNGIVSIVLEDNILGYVGKVEGSVYIDFPNDLSLDTAGRFTFYIKRSPIDDSMPELEDYYFNGFSQNIDKIEKILADRKLEIDQKIAESETQIDGKLKDTNDKITKANQDIAALNTNIDKANDCIDQTNQQIGNLGKLKKMYSNSIDFWDYDYSGNPNLLSTITSDYFTTKDNVTITNENRGVKLTFRNSGFGAETGNVMQIKPQTTYTLSAKVTVNEDFVGDLSKVRLTYRKFPGGNILLGTNLADTLVGETKMISVTGSVSEMKQVERTYLRLDSNSQIVDGSISIEYIKLEEGAIPTPYH